MKYKVLAIAFLVAAFSLVGSTAYAKDNCNEASAKNAGTCNVPGDVNGDGKVNTADLSIMLSKWGTSEAKCDLNGDGTVNILDLSVVLTNFDSNKHSN